jgi:thioredoxin-dependent peroxiredoxin
MIEPSKATKGRRMSKKTQKKTLKSPSKTGVGKPSRAASKKPTAKPAARKKPAKAAKASHRDDSKVLKAQRPKAVAKPKITSKVISKTMSKASSRATSSKPAAPKSETPMAANPLPRRAAPAAAHAGLAEGTKAPAFHLPRDGGAKVSLSDFAGQKLVLFFYPRADTPGCTKEAIDFTRLAKAFADSRTAVLGVSADPPKAQEAFRNKHQLSVPLASDEQHAMLEAYGVWGEKSMYGRTFLGISRTTVLIGPDSRVIRIWRHVKVDGHADEVLAAAQSA